MRKTIFIIISALLLLIIPGCGLGRQGIYGGSSKILKSSAEKESSNDIQSSKDDETYITTNVIVEEEIIDIDTSIVNSLVSKGYTLEQAGEIQKILNTVGITSIEIENMTGNAQAGINAIVCFPNGLTDRNRRFYFTTEDGILFYAGFLNEDLYDSVKGGFLKSYNDVHVPETKVNIETYNELQMLASDAVRTYLTVPSTADFDNYSWGIGRSDDRYKIQGMVTAKNMIGIENDIYFGVWFIKNDIGYEIEGIVIDGIRVK